MSNYAFLNLHDELYKLWQIVQNTPCCYGKSPCPSMLSLTPYKISGDYYHQTFREAVNYAKYIYDNLYIMDDILGLAYSANNLSYESALAKLGESEVQGICDEWFQQQYKLIELARYWLPLETKYNRIAGVSVWDIDDISGSGDDYAEALEKYEYYRDRDGYPDVEPHIEDREGNEDISLVGYFNKYKTYNLDYYEIPTDPNDKIFSSDNYGRLLVTYRQESSLTTYYSDIIDIPDTVLGDSTVYNTVDYCNILLPTASIIDGSYALLPSIFKDVPYIAGSRTRSFLPILSPFDVIGDLHPELEETETETEE